MKSVIFDVGDTGVQHQECQSEEFVEQETREGMSSGVGHAVEDLVGRSSCLFVGEKVVGIGDVELDFEVSAGLVGRDTG